MENKKYTIQITYKANDDNGKAISAKSAYWVDAEDIPSAYAKAEKAFAGRDVKFGFILEGHHSLRGF